MQLRLYEIIWYITYTSISAIYKKKTIHKSSTIQKKQRKED